MAYPPVLVDVAFASAPLAAAPTFTDISSYVREIHTVRGRSSEFSRPETGTGIIVLDNADRRFDPTNTASPYNPNVQPMKEIRIRRTVGANTRNVWYGHVEDWAQDWSDLSQTHADAVLSCVESTVYLANLRLSAVDSYAQELSGTRINNIADDVGWPGGRRDIAVGQSLIAAVAVGEADTVEALSLMQDAADAERGVLFVKRAGLLTFHDRHTRLQAPYTTVQATFSDDPAGGEFRYHSLTPSYAVDEIVNDWRITPSSGNEQATEDATSIAAYLRRTKSETLPLAADVDAKAITEYLVGRFKDPFLRFLEITVKPGLDDALWDAVLLREIGDRIKVEITPPGGGAQIAQEVHIEQIRHDWLPGQQNHSTTFRLSVADPNTYWILGDTTLSVLGTTTRLAA